MATSRASRSVSIENAIVPCTVETEDITHLEIRIPDGPDTMVVRTDMMLGEGAFGVVLGGTLEYAGEKTEVAVKCSHKKVRGKDLDRLRDEVRIMKMMKHPHIVRFIHAAVHMDYVYIVMERCLKKSLQDVIREYTLSMEDVLRLGHQIVDAIAYIHSRHCIHRDLKPGNFVFDSEGNIKITDFGLSSSVSTLETPRKTVAGTYSYMAPELMKQVLHHQKTRTMAPGFRYNTEIDVYSLGVVLFFLATRASPYWNETKGRGKDPDVLCKAVSEGRWEWPRGFHADIDFMKLVESMLQVDGTRRPDLRAVQRHAVWLKRPKHPSVAFLKAIGVRNFEREFHKLRTDEDVERTLYQNMRRSYDTCIDVQQRELKIRSLLVHEYDLKVEQWRRQRLDLLQKASLKVAPSREASTRSVRSNLAFAAPSARRSFSTRRSPSLESDWGLAEGSARYSFRQSTLSWHPESKRTATTDAPESRKGAEGKGSPSSSSRKRTRPSPSPARGRRTPSFWLDGPPAKWEGSSPQFDSRRHVVRCPRKHVMQVLDKFPKLNETGTDDYGWGFWCDACHKEVATLTKTDNVFYHCKCGYDLCKTCGVRASTLHPKVTTVSGAANKTVKPPLQASPTRGAAKGSTKPLPPIPSSTPTPSPPKARAAQQLAAKLLPKTHTPPSQKDRASPRRVGRSPLPRSRIAAQLDANIPTPPTDVTSSSPPHPAKRVPRASTSGATTASRSRTNKPPLPTTSTTPNSPLLPSSHPMQTRSRNETPTHPTNLPTTRPTFAAEIHDNYPTTSLPTPHRVSIPPGSVSPFFTGSLPEPLNVHPNNSLRTTTATTTNTAAAVTPSLHTQHPDAISSHHLPLSPSRITAPHEVIAPEFPERVSSTVASLSLTGSPSAESSSRAAAAVSSRSRKGQPSSPLAAAFTPASPVGSKPPAGEHGTPSSKLRKGGPGRGRREGEEVEKGESHGMTRRSQSSSSSALTRAASAVSSNAGLIIPQEISRLEGWIQHYQVVQEENLVYFLYQCQVNCYGALIMDPIQEQTSAIVHDLGQRMVYYIPTVNQNEGSRAQHPHPYVHTVYTDTIQTLRESEATRNATISTLVRVLADYAQSIGTYQEGVSCPERVVYVRKFFFDFVNEDPRWYMMRLSNGRTQISHPNEYVQIRWISQSLSGMDAVPKYRVRAGSPPQLFQDIEYFASIRETLEKFEEIEA